MYDIQQDASLICGAVMYSASMVDTINGLDLGRYNVCIIWDESGQLYSVDPYTIYPIHSKLNFKKTNSRLLIVFDINADYYSNLNIKQHNAILSRIEDIYGMSISEFSLGLLEYV